jgi:hypothetical protein
VDALMLDIGGDVGALVLHAPAELVDQEVEVSLIDQAGIRIGFDSGRRCRRSEPWSPEPR